MASMLTRRKLPDDDSSGRINGGSVLLSSGRTIATGEGSLHVVLAPARPRHSP
jgi:hypothetical protein